jgi:hypothetical protein
MYVIRAIGVRVMSVDVSEPWLQDHYLNSYDTKSQTIMSS